MFNHIDNKNGFALIELIVLIVIIGILATIAIPKFIGAQDNSKEAEATTNLGAIGTTAEAYKAEKGTYVVSVITDLGFAPVGNPSYSYWYAVGAEPGNPTPFPGSAKGKLYGCNRDTAPTTFTVTTTTTTFTVGAKGQIDKDPSCDEWRYDQNRVLAHSQNDNLLNDKRSYQQTTSSLSTVKKGTIIGKWQRVGPKLLVNVEVLEFSKDGTITGDGERLTYKFLDDTHISIGESSKARIFEVQVSNDLLTLRDQFGNPQQFTRLK